MSEFACENCGTEFSAPLCCGEEMSSAGNSFLCEGCGQVMDEVSAATEEINCCE
ncbi:hypothetical protein [Fuchsiella alkaliacetigena]|uniref:hypothetical protein n=1 Tax=Fuchsiella alkaliacetigena TaxID=957042 RepID=UPI00200B84A2|nr:hypothetical protein [Fuchsiella alkaliacetigena]MCK8823814.1 hypothetical protein [Fuchsiella alkaliacetigena]